MDESTTEKIDRILAATFLCHYCGTLADTIDHVVPRVHGGTDDPSNLVPACRRCNSRKGARPYHDFLLQLLFEDLMRGIERLLREATP